VPAEIADGPNGVVQVVLTDAQALPEGEWSYSFLIEHQGVVEPTDPAQLLIIPSP